MKHLVWFLLVGALAAQAQKKALTHADYNRWERLSSNVFATDGKWAGYKVEVQEGDDRAAIFPWDAPNDQRWFERTKDFRFFPQSHMVLVQIAAPYDQVRSLKARGKSGDDLPKNKLIAYSPERGKIDTLGEVKSYKLPEEGGKAWAWVAYTKEEVKPKSDTASAEPDSTKANEKPTFKTKEKLLVTSLEGEILLDVPAADDYGFSKDGSWLVFWRKKTKEDAKRGLYAFDINQKSLVLVDSTIHHLGTFAFGEKSKQLVYSGCPVKNEDSAVAYSIYQWMPKKEVKVLVGVQDGLLNPDFSVSPHARMRFDPHDRMLFFGIRSTPEVVTKDTTSPADEKVNLDIWHWNDPYIQPMQLAELDDEKRRSYATVLHLKKHKLVQIETEAWPNAQIDVEHLTPWVVINSTYNYRKQLTWEYPTPADAMMVEVATGKTKAVFQGLKAFARMSPGGLYTYWYNATTKQWVVQDVKTGKQWVASAKVPHPVWDEEHDTPSPENEYGAAGWTANDASFVFYDRYDLWQFSPKDATISCLTKGEGRTNKVRYRYRNLDRDEPFLPKEMWLEGFHETTKGSSLAQLTPQGVDQKYAWKDKQLVEFSKGKDLEQYWLRVGSFEEYPQLKTGAPDTGFMQVSAVNDFQKEYNWGTVELMEYTALNGDPHQALVYKPENFDPAKKYPVLVYFYERYTDEMHSYYPPAPSASIINFSYCASNGYVVLVPDISYRTGTPGESAYNCILGATKKLMENPWVDPRRMGLQGQSWGGYQTAYLVTKTDSLFACAMAGAPVSNMTSAYGGVRWESGMSRMFQYEQTQSRIGGTLWEAQQAYIENSPVFFAPKVQTPLLIMHNDNDGAVPWYQGIEYYMALRRLGKPVWMLVYNGEAHNLRKRHNRKDLSIRMEQFFDHYLKGAPEPQWMHNGVPAKEKGQNYGLDLITPHE